MCGALTTISGAVQLVGEYVAEYIAKRYVQASVIVQVNAQYSLSLSLLFSIRNFNPTPENKFVLGLPTGSSPIPTYKHLISLVKKGEISFKNVVTFNMDEYVGLPEDHPESYHTFMCVKFYVIELDGGADTNHQVPRVLLSQYVLSSAPCGEGRIANAHARRSSSA